MGYLSKKSKEETDLAEKNGDFTGGYNFLAWLIWRRWKFMLVLIVFFGMTLHYTFSSGFWQMTLALIGLLVIIMVLMRVLDYGIKNKKK